ncbi:formate dehydrogenase subunit delta [Ottowia thiooxydans]|uniref:formate dehydrogenase subunit delta n=1 Tax=Ottowia thiooxydans TaxID=219182 RepID=UPI0003F90BE0|nr:formate dehydrogenase subunit delta [Ottowia thiooxydans]
MDTENLANMANRIGQFFESLPDREEALDSIANHILLYWEPRMRRAIVGYAGEASTSLSPIVAEALRVHGHRL